MTQCLIQSGRWSSPLAPTSCVRVAELSKELAGTRNCAHFCVFDWQMIENKNKNQGRARNTAKDSTIA
eukprot:2548857-Pleurochrysis_carterae.AAC.1